MIHDKAFLAYAIANGMDVSYNTGSRYFNSKATRIAYFTDRERATMRTYQTEFPDFVLDVQIPAGFTDNSWHNDTMPNFIYDFGDCTLLKVWIDYADENMREHPGAPRFLVEYDVEGDSTASGMLLASDNWQEVVDFVKTYIGGKE